MDFITIKEYFYKFHSRLLFILLIPIMLFIALYFHKATSEVSPVIDQNMKTTVTAIVAAIWLLYIIFHFKKIKSARNGQGLRQKLEKYFTITIVRFFLIALISLVLAFVFFLTADDFFTYAFIVNLFIGAITWPGSKGVSKHLKLRGDEREMVYYKKDSFD